VGAHPTAAAAPRGGAADAIGLAWADSDTVKLEG
jgi:hypothetical protein